jgi:protein SCO1
MRSFRIAAVALLSILLTTTAPRAADGRTAGMNGNAAHDYFTDVQLVNQNGDTMRLYSDLIDGKVVIINSFFASCSGSCPVMAGNFAQIQKHLGDRLGKDVNLISISVDPTADTPEKLKEYAARFHARPGWYFLTGKKANVDLALRKLGQYVDEKNDHFNIIIIGNERTGLWKKAFGLAKPDDLIPIVDSVLNDKG